MLNGTPAADVSRKRYRGYCLAFEEAGLAVNTDYLRYCDFDEGKAIQATLELLQRHPRITAIFAASDLMAIGACRAIGQLGMVPGTDIDVIGFDDIPIAKYLFGGVSTIRQDPYQLGCVAGEAVYSMLQGGTDAPLPTVGFDLILRRTATP